MSENYREQFFNGEIEAKSLLDVIDNLEQKLVDAEKRNTNIHVRYEASQQKRKEEAEYFSGEWRRVSGESSRFRQSLVRISELSRSQFPGPAEMAAACIAESIKALHPDDPNAAIDGVIAQDGRA